MVDEFISWDRIREKTYAIANKAEEVQRLSGWQMSRIQNEIQTLSEQFAVPDKVEALAVLLDIFTMRENLIISESINETLQFALMQAMWLRKWNIDETKRAIAEICPRLGIVPATPARQVTTLLEVGLIYHHFKPAARWVGRDEKGTCAELLWLTKWSEHTLFDEVEKARERYNLERGDESKALMALFRIELIFRRTRFGDGITESQARFLSEIMWMRDWDSDRVINETVDVQLNLALPTDDTGIRALHRISVLAGASAFSSQVAAARDVLCKQESLTREEADRVRMNLAEYMFIYDFTLGQALERISRFSRANKAAPSAILDAMVTVGRQYYREKMKKNNNPDDHKSGPTRLRLLGQ
jgi:hypothetical protein